MKVSFQPSSPQKQLVSLQLLHHQRYQFNQKIQGGIRLRMMKDES
jgi:hypothetical protein